MNKLFIPLILLVCLFYTLPFFHTGYFPTQDGGWAVVRLAEMVREFKDLQIPPRWSDFLNHGYGYPLFHFTYPFPYYVGALLKFVGFGLVDSIKILFVSSVFLSAISMYFFGKRLTNSMGGFIGAILYVTASYRLTNLYIRGSLGESLSLILFPLLMLSSIYHIDKPEKKSLLAITILLAALILTHNASAILFFPLWIAFTLVYGYTFKKKKKQFFFRNFIIPVFLGFGISAYFFIPALLEKKFIILSRIQLADPAQYVVSLKDLVFSSSYLSVVHSVAAIVGCVFLLKERKQKLMGVFLLLAVSFYIFFSTSYSLPFWSIPPFSWMDFPFRMFNIIIFLVAFVSVFIAKNRYALILGIVLVLISVYIQRDFIRIQGYEYKPDEYFATNDATTTSKDELMPVWVSEKPKNRFREKFEVIEGESNIGNAFYNSNRFNFHIWAQSSSQIQVNSIYFPGWKLRIDNNDWIVDYSGVKGLMVVNVDPGEHIVEGKYTQTPIRLISDSISLISLSVIVILMVKKKVYV